MFFLGRSTILKDTSAWKSTKNTSKRFSERYFFASCSLPLLWVAFGLNFVAILASQMEPSWAKQFQAIEKTGSNADIIPKRVSKMPLKVVLGRSWGGLRGILGVLLPKKPPRILK